MGEGINYWSNFLIDGCCRAKNQIKVHNLTKRKILFFSAFTIIYMLLGITQQRALPMGEEGSADLSVGGFQ
jgi:hypothetical protein